MPKQEIMMELQSIIIIYAYLFHNIYLMKIQMMILLIIALLPKLYFSQASCNRNLQCTSRMMLNFTNNAYNLFQVQQIYEYLQDLSECVKNVYLYCKFKFIPDPDTLYPRDISQCMLRLYQTSLLEANYSGNFDKIKNNLDPIAQIIFSAGNNCRPVMAYTAWTNLTNDCKNYITYLIDLLQKYSSDISKGGNGFTFINDLILLAQKIRKSCGFDVLIKPKTWSRDICNEANNKWLYPLVRDLNNFIHQGNYNSFIQKFYIFYQSIYRVKSVCGINEYKKFLSQE